MPPIVIDYQIEKTTDLWWYPRKRHIQRWLGTALEVLGIEEALEVTIRLVSAAAITELNRKYRHKARPTNVLSFPCDWTLPQTPRLLGDIVIAARVVDREAEKQKKERKAHWAHISVHGLLHLFGYDHGEEEAAERMEHLERRILAQLGFADPYCGEA